MTARRTATARRSVLVLTLLVGLLASDARADEPTVWRIDPAASAIAISATQMGGVFEGTFRRFAADIRFDPNRLEGSQVTVTIETGSLDTGNDQRDETARGRDWFDVARYPTARFEADRFRAQGGGYEAEGTLTIKGIVQPVTLPFDLVISGDHASVAARLAVPRAGFELGTGEWASNGVVGPTVAIRLTIAAVRLGR